MEMRKNILIALLIFTAAAVCYNSVLLAGFVWDDEFLVVQNPLVRAPLLSFQLFKQDIINSGFKYSVYYRPIQIVSYALDYRLWGISPAGFHFSNIFLHFLNGLLVFLLAWKLTREKTAGLLAGVFFVISPALSGAVSYISGRTDLLFFFFGLLYMLFHVLYFEKKKISFLWTGIFFLLFSLLSKEAAVIFPFLLLLMYLILYRKSSRSKAVSLIPGFILVGLYALLHKILLGGKYAELFTSKDVTTFFSSYAGIVKESFSVILFPVGLHLRRVAVSHTGLAIAALAVLAIFILAILYLKKDRSVLFFGLGFFLVGLIPFAFISSKFGVVGEHWVYLASAGIFLFLGIAITELYRARGVVTKGILIGLVFVMVSTYSSLTAMQNRYWQSDLALSSRVMDFSEADRTAVYYKAVSFLKEGRSEEALLIMDEYVDARGSDHVALYLKGRLAASSGNLEAAEEAFKKAIQIKPDYDDGYLGLAMAAFMQGEEAEGISYLKKTLEINPEHMEGLLLLGMAHAQSGDRAKALEVADKARSKNPYQYDSIMTQGNIYLQAGDLRGSAECYLEASRLYPERPEAYYWLGYVFYKGGEGAQAIIWLKKAVIIDPSFSPALDLIRKIKNSEPSQ